MSRPLRWPPLYVQGKAFVQGFADAGDGVFTPDRYREPLAQIEYEAGWGFGRWCIRRGIRIRSFAEVDRQQQWGEGSFHEYLMECPVNMPQVRQQKDH
ncbi:MAG: hypothetical protein E6Q97_15685 [Desulfurellales bacterium]|nr:MAG: hypothetical protein E6Q97_15685 [Desulfurellales bacterium]